MKKTKNEKKKICVDKKDPRKIYFQKYYKENKDEKRQYYEENKDAKRQYYVDIKDAKRQYYVDNKTLHYEENKIPRKNILRNIISKK